MSCFNRGVSLRMFCGNDSSQHIQIIMTYPLSTLSRRVSGDSAQALRHNKNGVQTAFKRQANSQITTLLTACTPPNFFGAGALSFWGINGFRQNTNQPQTQPGLSPNLFPAHQFVVSKLSKMQWGDLTCPVGRARNTPALISISHRVMGIFIIVCIASTSHWEPAHTGSLLNQI